MYEYMFGYSYPTGTSAPGLVVPSTQSGSVRSTPKLKTNKKEDGQSMRNRPPETVSKVESISARAKFIGRDFTISDRVTDLCGSTKKKSQGH